MLATYYKDSSVNAKQFNETRLAMVVDYATEAAFIASISGSDLGITYQDLQSVRINPKNALTTFKSVIALSYDMAISEENLRFLDDYISAAVVALSDGYYIATLEEIDTKRSLTEGSEYGLMWGLKKPYSISYGPNKSVAYNLGTEDWILAQEETDGTLTLKYGETFDALALNYGIPGYDVMDNSDLDGNGIPDRKDKLRQEIITRINTIIAEDINHNIKERNEKYKKMESKHFVYLPSTTTSSGINVITKPSILFALSNVDFAGYHKLEAMSVGGYTVTEKRRVLAYKDDIDGDGISEPYYCYETQLPEEKLHLVEAFYNSVEAAAMAGYRPDVDCLRNQMK